METQDQTDCSKIQYVQSIEFSPDDFMWIVDVDRKYFNDPTAADNSCPPKMVLVDIESGSIVDTYVFPSEVAPYTGSFLITITDAPSRIRHQTVVGGALCPHPSDLAMQMDMWMRSLDCAKSKNMRIHAQCMRMVTKGSHAHSWLKYSLHSVHSWHPHAQYAHACAVWACIMRIPCACQHFDILLTSLEVAAAIQTMVRQMDLIQSGNLVAHGSFARSLWALQLFSKLKSLQWPRHTMVMKPCIGCGLLQQVRQFFAWQHPVWRLELGRRLARSLKTSLRRPCLRRIQQLGGPQMGLWTVLHQDCRDVTPWLEAMGHCTERPMHQRPVCLITSTPQSFSMFQSLER